MKALYHYSYSFADAMVPELVSRANGELVEGENAFSPGKTSLLQRAISKTMPGLTNKKNSSARLLSLGSIFQFARSGDTVWGTGVNPHFQKPLSKDTKIDIRSVRGPLSRQYIIEELGLSCPESFGDPGILIPGLFPEFKRAEKPKHDYLVICQHVDELYVRKHSDRFKDYNILLCQRPDRMDWRLVVQEILDSRVVIASSLHALIIAEAFGIPARWWYNDLLPSYYKAGQFKYNDYYLSTGRETGQSASSIDEALEIGGLEPVKIDLTQSILDAFPKDLFPSE